ncbi:hypothetical protein [Streptantibioticus ferralitis]|uniref:Uncharacterized protein n=1 Tax=Streptantibioticus ferralitis TaxID=236510 RepID=A0ABT5ZCP9_9ACTN|nr:hypothetical protein [Streptantibioticus ferralitis]MDF2261626.1 hypothetical protein [Streptantibioticus ferralitis]
MPPRHHHPAPRAARTVTAAAGLLATTTPAARTALDLAATALFLLLTLTSTLALGAAYVPRAEHRTAARHTLHLLLCLAPWYPPRP